MERPTGEEVSVWRNKSHVGRRKGLGREKTREQADGFALRVGAWRSLPEPYLSPTRPDLLS